MAKAKPGKWAHLVGKLPRLVDEDPKDQEVIEALKAKMIQDYHTEHGVPPSPGWLVETYHDKRHYKETLARELKDTELELSAITQLIENVFEAQGINSLRLSTGEALSFFYEPKAVIVDRAAHVEWAKKNGLEAKLELPWSTSNSELKKALDEGRATFDGEKVVGGPDGVQAFIITKFRKGTEQE